MKILRTILCILPLLWLSATPVAADELEDDPDVRIVQDEIIYNILVDRFNNGDQAPSDQVDLDDPYAYHGGDLQGITDMLQQLDGAGFTAVSISPIMENKEDGYHGYWVDDFFEVEEEFGTMDDLQALIKEAHELDMRVLLELDLNHIAKSSELANDNTKEDWFKENDVEPTDATEWLDEVVAFDQTNEDTSDYLKDVAEFWMEETDIDGYNFHAADQYDPAFLEDLTADIKQEQSNFYLIATTLQEDGEFEHLFDIDGLDAVSNPAMYEAMNDAFSKPDEPVADVYNTFQDWDNHKNMLYVDNMNTPRFSNNFGDQGRNAETTWGIALGYLYFTPGVPMIYQGSEIPMYGPGYPENQNMVEFTSGNPDLEEDFEKMASIRDQFPSLARGDIEQVAEEGGMSLFKREYENEVVFVAINNDGKSHSVEIEGEELSNDVQLRGLLHDDTIRENKDGTFLIGMERESSEVFVIRDNKGFNWGFIAFVVGLLSLFVVFVIVMSIKQKKRERNQQTK